MEDEEGAEDAEVRSIITSPDGPRPQQLRSGRDFWQLYEKGETLGRGPHRCRMRRLAAQSPGLANVDLAADLSPAGGKKRTRRNNHTPTHPATTPPGTIR